MVKKKNVKKTSGLSIIGLVIMGIVILYEFSISFYLNELEMGACFLIIIIEIIELCKKEVKRTIPIITIILAVLCFTASWFLTPTGAPPITEGWENIQTYKP